MAKTETLKTDTLCVSIHEWSQDFCLCPQHNGCRFEYCRKCGSMRLTEETRNWMNENNPKQTEHDND